jgi:outer membrane protein TolC
MKRSFLFLLFISCFVSSFQVAFSQAPEKRLTLENTFDLIRRFHPVAKQAGIQVELASSALQASRGAFDPAFYLSNQRKTFDGKDYFTYVNPELKIPTWYGIDLKAGIENNGGDRLGDESTFGQSSYAGISIPILKGLLFDKRRSTLQQAKLMVGMSKQEQILALNNLLFDAADAYWKWVASYQVNLILLQAVEANKRRFAFTRQSFLLGDRAAIDTTESLAQLQTIQAMQQQAWYEWQKNRLALSNFLWKDDNQYYELPQDVVPDSSWAMVSIESYPLPVLDNLLTVSSTSHPKLLSMGFKQDALKVEKREKLQNLLPRLDVDYNFLNSGYNFSNPLKQALFQNNYKYGLTFGLPLLQRSARGEFNMAQLKINNQSLEIRQTRLEIENKIKASFSELLSLKEQVLLMQGSVKNQRSLLKAEETKFAVGESSMFLVNTRETKLLETQQKLMETTSKFFKSLVAAEWSAGQLR